MIDIIGTITRITNDDPESPVTETLEGYHVNSTELLPELNDYLVEPEVPMRVFAGVKTHCYRFKDEAEYKELLGGDEDE
jgi:hypothetical protein